MVHKCISIWSDPHHQYQGPKCVGMIWKKSLSCFNLTNCLNISEKCPFNQQMLFLLNFKFCFDFCDVLHLEFRETGRWHVVRKSAKIWTRGFFMEALCPGEVIPIPGQRPGYPLVSYKVCICISQTFSLFQSECLHSTSALVNNEHFLCGS